MKDPNAESKLDTQTARVLAELRDLILKGQLRAGERLVEAALGVRLAASRTPIRTALLTLERQGLVCRAPSGGYTVRTFTPQDVAKTICAHAALEGVAARFAAEQGLTRGLSDALQECLTEGDRLAAIEGQPSIDTVAAYMTMNQRFHALIVEAANNNVIRSCLDMIDQLPFGVAGGMLQLRTRLPGGALLFPLATRQHRRLVEAIRRGEGARAQAIAEEHRHQALEDFQRALALPADATGLVPALRLVGA